VDARVDLLAVAVWIVRNEVARSGAALFLIDTHCAGLRAHARFDRGILSRRLDRRCGIGGRRVRRCRGAAACEPKHACENEGKAAKEDRSGHGYASVFSVGKRGSGRRALGAREPHMVGQSSVVQPTTGPAVLSEHPHLLHASIEGQPRRWPSGQNAVLPS
jgi:hypothetical protein